MKFIDIVKLKTALHIFKADKELLPAELQHRYKMVNKVHVYNTRNNNKMYQNTGKGNAKRFCLSIKGVMQYNKIPAVLKMAKSVKSFKNQLKKMIISEY